MSAYQQFVHSIIVVSSPYDATPLRDIHAIAFPNIVLKRDSENVISKEHLIFR